MSDKMSIDKTEPSKEHSEESPSGSNSDHDHEAGPTPAPQEAQPAKRKGGRKPIYATSEERKQRNRQAQAAFRERRTEYIKQLEQTISIHETNLSNLQAAHRSAADECLMLRYKNSLLERILLEKGIDVQAELRAKTGSPNLGPTHMPQNMVQPPPIQRAIMSRHHHSRRSNSSIAPKLEPGTAAMHGMQTAPSPKTRPTPPSHVASPTTSTPGFGSQSAASPTTSDQPGMRPPMSQPLKPTLPPMQGPLGVAAARQQQIMQQQQQQHQQQQQPQQQQQQQQSSGNVRAAPYYPTPSFQNHIEQLGKLTRLPSIELWRPRLISVSTEQEYDAPNDMIDDVETEASGPGPYPAQYQNGQQHGMSMQQSSPNVPAPNMMPHGQQAGQTQGQQYPTMTQLLDPALDWDPFGLSASMAFPTTFSFDTSSMR